MTLGEADDTIDATPDELLLELMDLVQLAFPDALREMTVTFVENDDGRRPALTNLDGKAAPGAPKRPDLGHQDGKVLDAVNALLADFADATEIKGGVRLHAGSLAVKSGPDGDRFVELLDPKGAVAMTRRFDKSELRWLFWTAPLFSALNESEAREAEQRRAVDEALAGVDSFQIDMQAGTISFSAKGSALARSFRFALLGSWSDETKNFLWGFANDQAPASLTRLVDSVRAGATGDGLRALTEGSFGCPERCAERLCRYAAAQSRALGLYRAPFKGSRGKGVMYLALLTD